MKDHETILKMIEEVDPNDAEKLDEIDRLVDEYEWNGVSQLVCPPKYTRSRDALKAIRPEGWILSVFNEDLNFDNPHRVTMLQKGSEIKENMIATLSTEELAELHAIIQAIAYERGES